MLFPLRYSHSNTENKGRQGLLSSRWLWWGEVQRVGLYGLTQLPLPAHPQMTLAQQLCRQHIIAGEHILEDIGPSNTRKWWTLAGQEITVTFNRLV